MTWTEMSEAVTRYAQTATAAEERGYRTWAWDILDRIRVRCQFTMLVGPTPLEACPTYPSWCPWDSLGTHQVIETEQALVLLDAVPQQWQQHVLEEAAKAAEWAVVARSTLLNSEAETWLLHNTHMLPIQIPKDHIRVYQKGWWTSGTKLLCKAPPGALQVWQSSPCVCKEEWITACTGLLPSPKDIANLHPLAEYHQYWNNQPSSPNMGRAEMEVWTDGSRQLLTTEDGKKALFIGAGTVSDEPDLNFEFQVRGERVVTRGEMGGEAEELVRAETDKSLAIFTNCMTLLQIIERWTRGDFTPSVEAEKHWDILSVILNRLRARTEAGAQTLIVWVKAHVGDVGNERADQAGDCGCRSEDILYDRPTNPFRLYDISNNDLISQHGWSVEAKRHASTILGRHTINSLRRAATPSNVMCTRALDGEGQATLGRVLQSDDVTETEKRNVFQCRGTMYPTATIVKRNKKGATSSKCQLCQKEEETISHMLMHCPETEGARHRAHDSITDPLLDTIAAESDEEWITWHSPVAWKIPTLLAKTEHPPRMAMDISRQGTPQGYLTTPLGHAYWTQIVAHVACPVDIASFTLDGLLWDRINKRIV
eukprot:1065619-Rhodomonas_salina.1